MLGPLSVPPAPKPVPLSVAVGRPWDGRLVHGVRLPAAGLHFFTWDPVSRRSPDRPWRRYGTDRLVQTLEGVAAQYAAVHPREPRIGIGDLSRPRGGDFGIRYGRPGHVSHQNGLDADVYYPRRDGRERAPASVTQIDRRLAQDLVDRFVRAGATRIFVGPNTGLRGPRGIVTTLAHHDNHLHVRLPVHGGTLFGLSVQGRPLRVLEVGDRASATKVLVVGCIHGNECAGVPIVWRLARTHPSFDLWLVPNLNPDGYARRTRVNAHGVDLNRNFPSEWKPIGTRGSPQYSGPRPLSEPESRAAARLVIRIRPTITLWYHQPQAVVRAWGPSVPSARRFARLAGMRFRALRWPHGTAPNWQNHRFPGASSFVVELPAGKLAAPAVARQARAVLALASQRARSR